MDVAIRHERSKNGEIVIHLFSPISFDSNVSHSLILDFFFILSGLGTATFWALLVVNFVWWRRRECLVGEKMLLVEENVVEIFIVEDVLLLLVDNCFQCHSEWECGFWSCLCCEH